jgi:hypothetical protein
VDLHKRETQLCIGHADGSITEQRDRDEPGALHGGARAPAGGADSGGSEYRERVGDPSTTSPPIRALATTASFMAAVLMFERRIMS